MQATCPAIIKKPAAANHIRDRTWSTIRGRRRARRLQAPARPETIYSDDWRSINYSHSIILYIIYIWYYWCFELLCNYFVTRWWLLQINNLVDCGKLTITWSMEAKTHPQSLRILQSTDVSLKPNLYQHIPSVNRLLFCACPHNYEEYLEDLLNDLPRSKYQRRRCCWHILNRYRYIELVVSFSHYISFLEF